GLRLRKCGANLLDTDSKIMKLSKFTTRLLCACFVVVLSTTLAMAQIDHNPATSGKTPPAQSKSRKQRLPTGPSTTKAPAGTKSTPADKAPAPDPSKPAVTTVEKTTPESELKPAEANESLTPEENKETETAKPSDTKTSDAKSGKDSDSSKASTKASDSIPELRDQIESADNPQEKAELQFKLV